MSAATRVSSWDGTKYVYYGEVGMVSVICARCAVIFGMPQRLNDEFRRSRTDFYCPHGHIQGYYGETPEKKLERQLANAREDARSARASAQLERRRHAATKGELTKTRKRAAAALCPVDGCHRQIVQMKRHLATKHPDYQPTPS